MSESVDIAWPGFDGRLRHETVAADELGTIMGSIALTGEELGWPGLSAVCHPAPDPAGVPSPWHPGREARLCRLVDATGRPDAGCSRSALARAVDRAASVGAEPVMAAEVEFLLRRGADGDPVYPYIENYGIVAGAPYEPILGAVRALGFGPVRVTASNPEYGPGQFEVNLSHGPALAAADAVALLRSHAEGLARSRGLEADFSAKPGAELSGNGLHVHQSLWSHGRNRFWSDGLSAEGRAYLGGLLASLRELAAIGSPTEEAYLRRESGSFCPTVVTWDGDNRTVAIRALADAEPATRLEQRDAAADANPYLVFAGQIHAGLDGIDADTDPGPRTRGNAYARDDLPAVPTGLAEAFELFEASALAVRVLGCNAHESFCTALSDRVGSATR
ncbi:MAG: glutamine synthetase [Solirubrobacterales bacterium]|nr:glutamine synthetase [Solirubrobacterales bacterium]